MGGVFGKKAKQTKVLVVGLDNSGKSTIINSLKPSKAKAPEINATVGFQVEQLKWNSVDFTMFDMSGQGRYRNLWEHYYKDTEAVIFVIDSTDQLRMCVVKDELEAMLKHEDIELKEVPILFFANKMDLPEALTPAEVSKLVNLDQIKNKAWTIVASNALAGTGLEEGMKWLSSHV